MNRGEFLDYIRNKLHTLDSGVGSSYEDVELYDFLDRAQLIVLNQQIAKGNTTYLDDLITTQTLLSEYTELVSSSKFLPNGESQFPIYFSLSDLTYTFYAYIGGTIALTRPNDTYLTISSHAVNFPLELLQETALDKFRISPVNRPYFYNPKVVINYRDQRVLIIPDYYMDFGSSFSGSFTYIKTPTKFADMATDLIVPDVNEALHFDIADKAADLAKTPLDAQVAYSEVKTDEEIKKSES